MENLQNNALVSPFDGKPVTKQILGEDGRLSFHVTAKELTPFRAKMAENFSGFTTLSFMGGSLFEALTMAAPELWMVIASVAAPLTALPFLKFGFKKVLRKKTEMHLSNNEFAVRKWRGWQTFDRRVEHRFSLVEHDRTRKEAEDNELSVRKAQAAGNVIRKARYYSDSFHLSYDYMGQRNDVAVIFGRKEAMTILSRLKACDAVMDMQASKGKAVHLLPEDEWGDQPGQIPQMD